VLFYSVFDLLCFTGTDHLQINLTNHDGGVYKLFQSKLPSQIATTVFSQLDSERVRRFRDLRDFITYYDDKVSELRKVSVASRGLDRSIANPKFKNRGMTPRGIPPDDPRERREYDQRVNRVHVTPGTSMIPVERRHVTYDDGPLILEGERLIQQYREDSYKDDEDEELERALDQQQVFSLRGTGDSSEAPCFETFHGRTCKNGIRCKFSHAPHVLRQLWEHEIKKLLANKFAPPDKLAAIDLLQSGAMAKAGGQLAYKIANGG
jgi:hypothetical protein